MIALETVVSASSIRHCSIHRFFVLFLFHHRVNIPVKYHIFFLLLHSSTWSFTKKIIRSSAIICEIWFNHWNKRSLLHRQWNRIYQAPTQPFLNSRTCQAALDTCLKSPSSRSLPHHLFHSKSTRKPKQIKRICKARHSQCKHRPPRPSFMWSKPLCEHSEETLDRVLVRFAKMQHAPLTSASPHFVLFKL